MQRHSTKKASSLVVKQNRGFTLIELSIVIIIIGLLIGGVIGGRELLHISELNTLISEKNQYTTAVSGFREKYRAYPGDMRNAQDYWGVANATASTCITTIGTGTQTCNGDGDGVVENGVAQNTTSGHERFRFWQHLSNAGFIDGSFTGVETSANADSSVAGINIPASKAGYGGWTPVWLAEGAFAGDGNWFALNYGHMFVFGAEQSNAASIGAILSPSEMKYIDNKIDDGKPGRGEVIAGYWDDCTNAGTNSALDATYLLAVDIEVCALIFIKQF